jgi:2-oxo-3-hexenedioate decarboxylase
MIDPTNARRVAQRLDAARLGRQELPPWSATEQLTLTDGYAVQREVTALRLARGERMVGYKMALTSKAKRDQMNLGVPIYGVLTDRMRIADGGTFSMSGAIHPRIEPEVAFITTRELSGIPSPDEAIEVCGSICAAMEIIDSRYVGFKYFSAPDVVADNSSAAWFILSEAQRAPVGLSLANLRMEMKIDGRVVQSALTEAISGNPILSLMHLCTMLRAHGRTLPAGSIVLAGAGTAAEPLEAGHQVSLEVEKIGEVRVRAIA